jgi:hypothetical protein
VSYFVEASGVIVDGENTLLTKRELCEAMDVSQSTIQRLMLRGLPYIRYINGLAFNVDEVRLFLASINYPPYEIRQKLQRRVNKNGKTSGKFRRANKNNKPSTGKRPLQKG